MDFGVFLVDLEVFLSDFCLVVGLFFASLQTHLAQPIVVFLIPSELVLKPI